MTGKARGGGSRARAAAIPVAPGLLWINECFPVDARSHEHISVYLLEGDEGGVLIDSGSFHHRESLRERIEAATEGRGLAALVLSHSDYPHAGNVGSFRRAWGDIEIVASSDAPEIQGLPYATRCRVGGTMEVHGRTLSFIDPPLADRSHTTWIYDHGSRALFTSDGFGNFHRPGQCALLSDGFEEGIPVEEVCRFHRETLSWLRYVDPPRLERRLREIFDAWEVARVCPIHGNVIRAEELGTYLERLFTSIRRIAAGYPGPGAGRENAPGLGPEDAAGVGPKGGSPVGPEGEASASRPADPSAGREA